MREIQEHLLNDIEDEHDLNHCLQEARKIESHIAQHKLLGLKSVQYDSTGRRDHGRSKKKSKFKDRSKSRCQSSGGIKDCKYCGSSHQCRQCPAYRKTCKLCGKKNHFAKKCHSGKHTQNIGSSKHKSFKYQEVNLDQESSDDQIDEITSKVKSMYYYDVHFNSVNTRMHINLNTKSCNGSNMKTCFKVDTGAERPSQCTTQVTKAFIEITEV